MLEETAEHLLKEIPLEEMDDDFADIVERYRYGMLSEDDAMLIMLEDMQSEIQSIIDTNSNLFQLLGTNVVS